VAHKTNLEQISRITALWESEANWRKYLLLGSSSSHSRYKAVEAS